MECGDGSLNLALKFGRIRAGLLALAAAVLPGACDNPRAASAETSSPASAAAELFAYKAPALGDDFYNHVNGSWIASYNLPADKYMAGLTTDLSDQSEEEIRAIIEGLSASSRRRRNRSSPPSTPA